MINSSGKMFTPIRIGSVEMRNRVALAPMSLESITPFENSYLDNRCKEYLVQRAMGGVGLMIVSCWRVDEDIEPMHHFHCNILTRGALYSIVELNEILHSFGAKVFYQLTAGFGRVGSPHPPGGGQPVAPSALPAFWDPKVTCRELSTGEIDTLVEKFGFWAGELKKAGVDGVELHAHEGYLFDQFSCAVFNKRTDKYGGDLEGRLTFAREILHAIKASAGDNFPVVYRYGLKHYMKGYFKGAVPGEDFKEFGRTLEEGLEMAKILERDGFDALHVDAGCYDSWYWPHPPNYMQHGCMAELAAQVKKEVNIPVIAVGRLDDPEVALEVIDKDKADIVAVGRGFLADAHWANKVRYGEVDQIRPCLGCHDACTGRLFNGKPMCCAVNPTVGRELDYQIHKAPEPKKIMIIGGGPAGMEAARVGAMRGHDVTLFETREKLGGHLVAGSVPEFKKDIRKLMSWYEIQLRQLGVTVLTSTPAGLETIERQRPDEILFCTGSVPLVPSIEGIDNPKTAHCIDVLNGEVTLGKNVVVIGGGLVGCEIALWAAGGGRKITIVERLEALMSSGPTVSKENRQMTIDLLALNNIEIRLLSTVSRVTDDQLYLMDSGFNQSRMEYDNLVVAAGMKKDDRLFLEAEKLFKNVRRIGDCLEVRNIQGAIWDGYEVARRL
ncbi:oxidoreductase [Desulforhopalus singaporensis]|uniref:2-enoate reductase n=1 Tax=Desulforhopalus singaporensis TaxID=91360 RepID=A0A1H0KI34_9BACT|nr:FAD-dependent oxidoreductase [Desulforhopalus singaporensis]SDO55430.1 2-enoate reductase [Desulforhopalus singaporensis]